MSLLGMSGLRPPHPSSNFTTRCSVVFPVRKDNIITWDVISTHMGSGASINNTSDMIHDTLPSQVRGQSTPPLDSTGIQAQIVIKMNPRIHYNTRVIRNK